MSKFWRQCGWFVSFSFSIAAWSATEIHVSTTGDDSLRGSVDEPLRTIGKAIEKSRTAVRPVSIVLGEGRFEVEKTLELGPEDSGLQMGAKEGAKPVLSGGRRLSGWEKDEARADLWHLTIPEVRDRRWYFQQLFVDGKRVPRARTPNTGYFRLRGPLGTGKPMVFPFKAGDLKSEWAQVPDARVIILQKWTDLHLPIQSINADQNTAELAGGPRPDWMTEGDARYWVENVPDALDAPGEWYLDRASGRLSWMAPRGGDPNRSVVVAPRITTMVEVKGDPNGGVVENITFRELTFSDTDYEFRAGGWESPQAAVLLKGALKVEFAKGGSFERCTFQNLGGYALEFGRGAQRWKVVGNEIVECGAGGIRVGEPGERSRDELIACRNHEITDNDLHALGRIFPPAVGIIVFQSGGNRIAHNAIHDLYYTAISVGWNWGYQETPCRENLIEFNHLYNIGQGMLSDMGGVYTLGIQPGTIVRNNLIHDVTSYDYGGWGLYTDEGSTGILLESNIVYRCKSSGFHQHYGRENTVRNNIFAFNTENQLMRSREEDHVSFFLTRNIICFNSGNLLGSTWKNDRFVLDENTYFDTRIGADPARLKFSGATWDDWRRRGHDIHSVVADPLFRDAASFDFQLSPDSPALKLGFHPIDVSQVGPRKDRTGRK